MANATIVSSHYGPTRASHLSHVTTGDASRFGSGAVREDESERRGRFEGPTRGQATTLQRLCTLRVHDRASSNEDFLLNCALFPSNSIRAGYLMQITAYAPGDKQQHESNTSQSKIQNQDTIPEHAKRRPVPMPPTMPALDTQYTQRGIKHLGSSKRHLFIAKELDPKTLMEQPNLEVGNSPSYCVNSQLLIFW